MGCLFWYTFDEIVTIRSFILQFQMLIKKGKGVPLPNSRRGSEGFTSTVCKAQLMKGGEPILLLLLPYPFLIPKRYPFTAGLTERVLQS